MPIELAKKHASLIRTGYLRLALTGAPSSGKTSVRKRLSAKGFVDVIEFAGQIIKEHEDGLHDLHPAKCMYSFNHENFHRQIAAEKKVKKHKLVILDRTLYDPKAYFNFLELDQPEYLKALPDNLYNTAFVFENLPWVKDGIRHEGAEFAEAIKDHFPKAYEQHGVHVVHVPVFPCHEDELEDNERKGLTGEQVKELLIHKSIDKRANFIIDKIKEHHPDAVLPSGV